MSKSVEATFGGTTRFEILGRLGGGGMGVVYEALDRETGARVALKTLRSMGAEALLLFKNEFRALADIQHPNLVSLGELFEEGGQWFFTMELVRGEHFLAHVEAPLGRELATLPQPISDEESTPDLGLARKRAASAREASAQAQAIARMPEAHRPLCLEPPTAKRTDASATKLRAALGQLARGLNALHDAKKVHRDIKPANILVTLEGRVVILDFGVITEAIETGAPSDAEMVGTISYMAPEQAAAQRVGPEADWYAVGVMLYQSLTGHLPVRGSLSEIAVLKRVIEPVPPRALIPDVPADLDELCAELLRIDPKLRPTGRDVLRRLGVEPTETASLVSPSDRFIGREAETAMLRAAFDETRKGAAVTVLLRGESGVGKTVLVRRFAESLIANEGALVLRSRCHERESVPYKAVDGVVDALSHHLAALPEDEARAMLPPHADLLAHVFPVLRKLPAIGPAADDAPLYGDTDPHELRARLFASMRELLTRIARKRPLLLCIDDLQWADADGLALLAEVMRPPGAPPLLLIGTLRAALATDSGPSIVQSVASKLPGEVRQIELGSLPAGDARALARELLGEGADAERIDAIAAEAGGHPIFIDELVRRRLGRAEAGAPLRLEDALWERISRLDPEVRRVLEIVVVAGAPIAQEIAASAGGSGFGEFSKRAAVLRAANLVRTDGMRKSDAIEPYHDRLRAAVLEHVDAKTKKASHVALALALEASESADPEALAVHFREAGQTDKAAAYAARAADEAARALAFDRAARLYRMSIALAPNVEEIGALHAKLGDALANAGRGADAAAAYLTAAPLFADAAESLDLRRRGAEQLLRAGHIDKALAAFGEVLAAVGLYAPRTPKGALGLLLARRAQLRLRGLSFVERDEASLSPELLTRIDACWAVGSGLGLVDAIRGSYFQVRALLLALDAGEPRRVARSLAGEVSFSSADGGRSAKRTARLLEQAEAMSQKIGDPYTIAWARGSAGIAAALEGRWSDAHAACDEAEALFRERCTGAVWEVDTMRWFGLWAIAYLGRITEASRRVQMGLREAEGRGDLYATVCHSTGLPTMTWLAEDDPEMARERCRDALERWSQKTFHVEHWWAMLGERQIDLYMGDGAGAYRAVGEAWPRLSSSLLLMVQLTELEALHLRARAALGAATPAGADVKALTKAAAADARKIRGAAMPWSNPLADLLDAGVASRRGDAQAALDHLTRGLPGLEAAGMALYAAAARYRRGVIVGGDEGRVEKAEAVRFMSSQSIVKPERFVAMLAPGFEDDSTD